MTDFGGASFYAGAMKGAVLSVAPSATLVDLTHDIRPFAIAEASFVLARSFELFPPATVFLVVVDPGVGGTRRNLVFEIADRYLVAPDNGLVSDVAESREIRGVYEIDTGVIAKVRKHQPSGRTFLGRDVFGPAAGFLAEGHAADALGRKVEAYHTLSLPAVAVAPGSVSGIGRYGDSFGNIITNVSVSHIRDAFGGAPLAQIQGVVDTSIGIDGIDEYFAERKADTLMLVLGSWGLVEIAVNQGSAVDRFGGDPAVKIQLSGRAKPEP